jgi:hypothetical protein
VVVVAGPQMAAQDKTEQLVAAVAVLDRVVPGERLYMVVKVMLVVLVVFLLTDPVEAVEPQQPAQQAAFLEMVEQVLLTQ